MFYSIKKASTLITRAEAFPDCLTTKIMLKISAGHHLRLVAGIEPVFVQVSAFAVIRRLTLFINKRCLTSRTKKLAFHISDTKIIHACDMTKHFHNYFQIIFCPAEDRRRTPSGLYIIIGK